MDGCAGELGKQSLAHMTSYNVLSIIILCIDLVLKSAETGLQMHKESEDVQKAVEHSAKQLKKGLQDCSYPQDQRFMTRNVHA